MGVSLASDGARLYCTACQSFRRLLGWHYGLKCHCGKDDTWSEPSQAYVDAYRMNLLTFSVNTPR